MLCQMTTYNCFFCKTVKRLSNNLRLDLMDIV